MPAAHATREQEVCDVRAGNQQDEHDRSEEHPQGRADVLDEQLLSRRHQHTHVAVRFGVLRFELAGDRVHFDPGIFERHAALHACDWKNTRMPPAILRQRRGPRPERHVDVRRLKQLEAPRHDSHDGVGLVIEVQRAPERVLTREPALGEAGAQERHAWRTRTVVCIG